MAILSLGCAIAAVLPSQYQPKVSLLIKGFAICILVFGGYLLYGRLEFIFINGGMEGPDGYGSPLAFLIGLIFEQTFFTLSSFYLLWAFSTKRVQRWQNA